jgi:DNA polymerase III alpha subunit
MNAYMTMWQKVHYPMEYYTALLNHSTNEELSWYIKQIKNKGIKFNEFTVGQTGNRFEVDYENNSIRFGLNLVKGLSSKDVVLINTAVADDLNSVEDIVNFIIGNKISKRTYEPLARLGYFKNIFDNSKLLENILNGCKNMKKKDTIQSIIESVTEDNVGEKDWQKSENFEWEKKYFDFYFNEHPFTKYTSFFYENAPDIITQLTAPKQLPAELEKGSFKLYGIVNKIIIKKSKKTNKEFYKIVLEDDIKQLFITVFNATDISDVKEGDFICIPVSKNKFGFTKSRGSGIKKLI